MSIKELIGIMGVIFFLGKWILSYRVLKDFK